MTRYLTAGAVARLNQKILGTEPIAEFGLLESAVLRPQTTIGGQDAYGDLHAKAAALFHSLIRNHPFLDGNKRTALVAVAVFYGMNGWKLEASDGDMVALALDVAEGIITLDDISKRLALSARAILHDEDDDDEQQHEQHEEDEDADNAGA